MKKKVSKNEKKKIVTAGFEPAKLLHGILSATPLTTRERY